MNLHILARMMHRYCSCICAFLAALLVIGCGGSGSKHGSTTPHWTITAAGGTFQTPSNEVSLVVPAGAVAADTNITYSKVTDPVTPPAATAYVAGTAWQFTHVEFTNPVSLSMSFPSATAVTGLQIYRKADGASDWTAVTTTIDSVAHTATASISSFSSYALFSSTAPQASAYWVEQRRPDQGNSLVLDVYGAQTGGSEALLYSPLQTQAAFQLRTNTYRWSDKSYLGLGFDDPATYLMSYNVVTAATTRLATVPHDDGTIISSLEMVRAKGVANSQYIAAQVSQRNTTTGNAKDSLYLFQGTATPTLLLSFSRTDADSPAIMRPWDVAADGRVLALEPEGLVMHTGTSKRTLASADLGPGEAYFSPGGNLVLYVAQAGDAPGWKVYNLSTNTTTAITGLENGRLVRWAGDDVHVIAAVTSGDARHIDLVDVATGSSSRITTAGAHSTSFINDVGVQ